MSKTCVKPDVVDSLLPEDAFYRSTILRVIDEEYSDLVSRRYGTSGKLRLMLGAKATALLDLRARFEEADDDA